MTGVSWILLYNQLAQNVNRRWRNFFYLADVSTCQDSWIFSSLGSSHEFWRPSSCSTALCQRFWHWAIVGHSSDVFVGAGTWRMACSMWSWPVKQGSLAPNWYVSKACTCMCTVVCACQMTMCTPLTTWHRVFRIFILPERSFSSSFLQSNCKILRPTWTIILM